MRSELLKEEAGVRLEGIYSEEPLTRDEIDMVRGIAREHYIHGKPFTKEQIEAIDRFVLMHEGKRAMGPEAVPGFGWLECRVSIKDGVASEYYGYKDITDASARVYYPLDPNHVPNHQMFQRFPGIRAAIEYS